jgi:3-hydroxyisobutyrate dehydrogenase
MSESTRIGWIGTGVMGLSMCGHLQAKGYPTTIYSRTKSRAQSLIDKGAAWADTPAAVAAASDVIFTIVGLPSDVREVYFGEKGLLSAARKGAITVDMTTTEPSLSREIYDAAKAKGVSAIDAPVSGGDVGAKNATLSIMVGGDPDAVATVMPLFQTMGKNIVHQGGAGNGQHTKMCNQIVLAGTIIGVCESLLYGYKAGLDLDTMLSSITKGAAQCWILDNLAPKMVKRNFDPGFFVEHFEKDLGIVLDESQRMGISMPGLALVRQFYVALKSQGHGRLGYHALLLVLEQLSAVKQKA